MDEKLLSTILELARLGAVGIGAIVLLLAFILLFRSKSIEPEKGKLINRFMTLGFFFGLAAGVLGLVPLFFTKPGDSGPVSLRLSFSPDMENAGLTPPVTKLPDGKTVPAEEAFSLPASVLPQVLTVKVDKTIAEVQSLRDTSKALADSVAKATDQRNELAKQIAPAAAAPAAEQHLEAQAQQTDQLQTEVTKSLQTGDFARANTLSRQLRTSVIKAQPSVTAIARTRPQQ